MSTLQDLAYALNGTTINKQPVTAALNKWGDVDYITVLYRGKMTDVRVLGSNVHWGVEGVLSTPAPSKNYENKQVEAIADLITDSVDKWEAPRPKCASWSGKSGSASQGYITIGTLANTAVYNA